MFRTWKLLAALAAVAAAFVIFTPISVFGVLPLLFVLACPLSMVLMGRMMAKGMRRQ